MAITQNGALKRDDNDAPVMGGTSSSDNATIINASFDPVTRRLLTDSAGGSGTVTSVSVVSANGFAGTVATATTTPAITLSTTITGVLSGNGTAISAASTTGTGAVVLANSPTFIDDITLGGSAVATGSILFKGTTSGTVTLSVADAAGTWTLKLPTSAGANTNLLQTDGSGNTSWVAAPAASLVVGTTTISSGTTTRILYDNAGTLGEYTLTGTGTVVVMATSPTLVTPVLGVATATSINKVAITAPASSATLTIADGKTATHNASTTFAGTDGKTLTISNSGTLAGGDAFVLAIAAGKTLTVSNTLTFTGTDASSVAFGTGGTVLYTASTIPLTVGSTTIASGTTTRILYDNAGVLGEYTLTGSGTVVVMATSPTFTTGATTPQLLATSNDSGALGASGTAFADLFLASGGVINWAANNSNITHSSGILTVGAGEFRITSANVGTNGDSVPTLSSTSTFTNKTLTSPTLTTPSAFTTGGTITLAENTSIALDPAGSADGKYTGITVTGTGGATLAFGDLIYLAVADSKWKLTDADAVATAGYVMMGMAVTTSTDGNPVTVLLQGIIRADANFPTLTVGAAVYVGEAAGKIQVAIPTGADNVIRVAGFALTADEIYFNPSQDHQTTVA